MTQTASHTPLRPLRPLAAAALVLLMILGGLVLWLGIPLGWLWLASQLASGTQPTAGPYMLIAVGVPISMALMAKALRRVDAVHARLTGRQAARRVPVAWLKSMRGERHTAVPMTALDLVLLSTAVLAVLALLVWFLAFAGNPLPN
jgi:hypothetical protein